MKGKASALGSILAFLEYTLIFEILDFPLLFGLIDAHALWHTSIYS